MNRICKRLAAGIFSMILIFSYIKIYYAGTPLSLALTLTGQSMKQGDTMHVSVALQNYDKNYTDNVITTIIVEVSVDTENISVNKDSIAVNLDEGSGMGFSTARMQDKSNVEMQYLNVGDPLEKGTKDLYSFDITALKDIDNLLNSIKITYVVMQDGTKATSEKLTVVPFVMVNGKAVEQESIDEKYTSEYGTIADDASVHEVISNVASENSGSNSSSFETSGSSIDSSQNENSWTGTWVESNDSGNSSSSNGNLSEDSRETEIQDIGMDSDGKDAESGAEKSDKMDSKETEEMKSASKKTENRSFEIIPVVIVCAAAAGAGVYFYRKKDKNNSQNNHN